MGAAPGMERDGSPDPSQYILVEDKGADTTLFIFGGMAVLYAGLPAFEFKKLLAQTKRPLNLVFLRDIQRMYYTVTPDGRREGLAFYERVINEQKQALGARHNVAMGASGGGAAALHFSVRCGLDQVIALNPVTDPRPYAHWRTRLHVLFDLKKAVTDFSAYIEVLTLSWLVEPWLRRRVAHMQPDGHWPDLLDAYREAAHRPRTTIVYGDNCRPDKEHAKLFSAFPEVQYRPVRSNRHNCAADLKKRGELGPLLLGEIEAALTEHTRRKEQA
jgi:hypothetical protein